MLRSLGYRLSAIAMAAFTSLGAVAEQVTFYTGGYSPRTPGELSTGIARWTLDLETGAMEQQGETVPARNPSFLAWSAHQNYIYAVSEVSSRDGKPGGGVAAYAVGENGELTLTKSLASGGGAPCYLATDLSGRHLLTANYGGSIATFSLESDGGLADVGTVIIHNGSSVNERRQGSAHPHCIIPSIDNRWVYVPDLGQDKLVAYRYDAAPGILIEQPSHDVITPPGSGPRHMVFHPKSPFVFVSLELSNQIASYRYVLGRLNPIAIESTLPADFEIENTTAEVRVHPTGKFAYISNRGHNSIAVFRIGERDGSLLRVGMEPTQGKTPRNFNIDPSGKVLIVANQQSDNLISFFIDPDLGTLTPTGHTAETPIPTYVLF